MSAALHLLARMQADPRLAYLIGPGSESYDLITAEAAEAAGIDVETLRTEHGAGLTFTPWPTTVEPTLRREGDASPAEIRAAHDQLIDVCKRIGAPYESAAWYTQEIAEHIARRGESPAQMRACELIATIDRVNDLVNGRPHARTWSGL